MSETPATSAPTTSKPSKPAQKRRFNYTLAYKMEVIKWAESTNNCQASARFGVPRQCIQSWRKMKTELMLEEIQGKNTGKKKRLGGGGRPLKNVEVDEKLEEWLKEKQANGGEKITGKMIKEYAMTISANEDFKASNGWLQRFMIRHGLAPPTRNQKTSESSSDGFEDLLNQLLQQSEEIVGGVAEVGGVEKEEEAGPPIIDMGAELQKLLGNFGGDN